MFKNIIIFLTIFLASIIQIAVLPVIFPSGLVPNIILDIIIFWIIKFKFVEIWKRIILAGIMLDIVSSGVIGINVVSLAAVALVISSLIKRFLVNQRTWSFFTILIFVFMGTILNEVATNFLLKLYGWFANQNMKDHIVEIFNGRIILAASINTVFFMVIYWFMKKIEKFVQLYDKSYANGKASGYRR